MNRFDRTKEVRYNIQQGSSYCSQWKEQSWSEIKRDEKLPRIPLHFRKFDSTATIVLQNKTNMTGIVSVLDQHPQCPVLPPSSFSRYNGFIRYYPTVQLPLTNRNNSIRALVHFEGGIHCMMSDRIVSWWHFLWNQHASVTTIVCGSVIGPLRIHERFSMITQQP